MNEQRIDVCIVDDHAMVRLGIIRLLSLSSRIGTIYEAGDGLQLLELLKDKTPDVILLDLQMPGMSGKEVCQVLAKDFPAIKIIILTMNDGLDMVEYLIQQGAHGFISKSSSSDDLEQGIIAVVEMGFYYNDLVYKALQKSRASRDQENALCALSNREIEIIRLICDELTMKEIAEKLSISEKTVQNHRFNIMEKLGVHNTAGIVKYAIRNLIVEYNK
ncbi:MAG: response regulator transcription factor [Cyclobacteriaceae bacterium]|nr:response regulator transcription factor [Cyclobacteriaceae bacterium]MBX2957222.1 response regulator transcription factor [Cyclobacteriaceae bacterium]